MTVLQALDASGSRVISAVSHIGYSKLQSYKVEFEELLRDAVRAKDLLPGHQLKHLSAGGDSLGNKPRIIRDRSTSTRMDGNNVDIDGHKPQNSQTTPLCIRPWLTSCQRNCQGLRR